jgi:hypothetical protein
MAILLVRLCLHLGGGCFGIVAVYFGQELIYLPAVRSLDATKHLPHSHSSFDCRVHSTTAVRLSVRLASALLPTEALLLCCGRLQSWGRNKEERLTAVFKV